MPDLYIANCTTRNKEFVYRLPEREKVMMMPVPAGAQVAVMRNANMLDMEHVIRQHTPYGCVSGEEVKRTPNTMLIDAIWSVDKPVNLDVIMRANEHNSTVLTLRGAEQRKLVALGVNRTGEETMPGMRIVETEVIEEPRRGDDAAGLRHKVEVSQQGARPAAPRRRKAA